MQTVAESVYKNVYDDMTAYMNDTYGAAYEDTFTYLEQTGSSYGSGTISALMESTRYPGKRVVVSSWGDDRREPHYASNYMALVFEDETRAAMSKVLDQTFRKYVLVYRVTQSVLDESTGPDTAFSDYIASPDSRLTFIVFADDTQMGRLSGSDQGVLTEQLRQAMKEAGISASVTLVLMDISDKRINENNCDQFLMDGVWNARCDFLLDDEFEYVYADWR